MCRWEVAHFHSLLRFEWNMPRSSHRTRLGKAFSNMLTSCPGEMGMYAACIEAKGGGSVQHRACETQFAALRECLKRSMVKSK
jgi:hypothetical protein